MFVTSHINFGLGSKELSVVTLRNMFKCIEFVMSNDLNEGAKTHKLAKMTCYHTSKDVIE